LFVAPGAGPRALYVRNLAEHLGVEQPLYVLQEPPGAVPGGADRSVEGLAQRFIVGMRRVQPRGPYDVVGISFGGLLAYEVARQLVADGEQVGLLALLDTRHPAFPRRRPSVAPGAFARRLANQVVIVRRVGRRRGGRYLRNRVRIGWSRSLEGLREGFASRLPAGLASFIRDDTLEWERAWQAADAQASARYRPLPYPGRLTFLWAEHSPTPADRSAWAKLAVGGFDARPVPGGHFTLLVEPLAGITASILANVLDAARVATGSTEK
jgi:thioesterase domain-containing protein